MAPLSSTENLAIPLLVLSRHPEGSEAINTIMRKAGHAVHCTWLPNAADLSDALIQINPQALLIFTRDKLIEMQALPLLRKQTSPPVPIILVGDPCDEAHITQALAQGAQDLVSLSAPERLRFVCERELHSFRLERALNRTINAAQDSQNALELFLKGSADAVIEVQEGIVFNTNPAWLTLLGLDSSEVLNGQPLMDFFDAESQSAVRGALVACLQGKWADHTLRAGTRLANGTSQAMDFSLLRTQFEGEPSVRFVVSAARRDDAQVERQLRDAVQTDPTTGLLHRRFFLEQMHERLNLPIKGGLRQVALIRLDKYEAILNQVGAVCIDDVMMQFGQLVHSQIQGQDLAGRFNDSSFILLLERGNGRDVIAWAKHIVNKVATHRFTIDGIVITPTATVGLSLLNTSHPEPNSAIQDAYHAAREAGEKGGNQVYSFAHAEEDTRILNGDAVWVHHIKAALMSNRFRLVQQPIASLLGDDKTLYDVLVRMLDEQNQEVLPSEFIPAAERNDLMKSIDRWVIGASMAFCASRKPETVFVRLARDSVTDRSLPIWLSNQLKAFKIEPQRLCFQVTEEVLGRSLTQGIEFRQAVAAQGFGFAIERFGSGSSGAELIEQIKPDFVKIDGALMQGIINDLALQQRVRTLVDLAKTVNAVTIAERVEDANTMAVMWQLGIEFIQGYLVHKPETVTLG